MSELVTFWATDSGLFAFDACRSDWFSFTMLVELLPVELLLVAFWYIPRHFFLPVKEINRSINDLHLTTDLSVPILADHENQMDFLPSI